MNPRFWGVWSNRIVVTDLRAFISRDGYSGIIVDLIDNDTKYAEDKTKGEPIGDRVSGFTAKQIQDAWLTGC